MALLSGSNITKNVSIRAVLALIFALGLTTGAIQGWIDAKDYKEVALIAITWYFARNAMGPNTDNKNIPPSDTKL